MNPPGMDGLSTACSGAGSPETPRNRPIAEKTLMGTLSEAVKSESPTVLTATSRAPEPAAKRAPDDPTAMRAPLEISPSKNHSESGDDSHRNGYDRRERKENLHGSFLRHTLEDRSGPVKKTHDRSWTLHRESRIRCRERGIIINVC